MTWPEVNEASLWAPLSAEEHLLLEREVPGSLVFDLGCGEGALSLLALRLGAAHVVAVDRHGCWHHAQPGLVVERASFEDIADGMPQRVRALAHSFGARQTFALVSWPEMHCGERLGEVLASFDRVYYRGRNTGGTACGGRSFWLHVLGREPLEYLPSPRNVGILYGSTPRREKTFHWEELAAIECIAALVSVRSDPLEIPPYSDTRARYRSFEEARASVRPPQTTPAAP